MRDGRAHVVNRWRRLKYRLRMGTDCQHKWGPWRGLDWGTTQMRWCTKCDEWRNR